MPLCRRTAKLAQCLFEGGSAPLLLSRGVNLRVLIGFLLDAECVDLNEVDLRDMI